MQLTYRAQSYKTSCVAVDAIATDETAAFMGRPYAGKQFAVTYRQQLPFPSSRLGYH